MVELNDLKKTALREETHTFQTIFFLFQLIKSLQERSGENAELLGKLIVESWPKKIKNPKKPKFSIERSVD